MIYFKKIRWKNLLSTGNVFTEIDLCSKDTTLIVGINGAGKSTLLDALSFGLFGKPFRKITKPQLINSITGKQCVVEIEFSIGSSEFKIIRGMKPTVFEIYKNGSLMNQSAEMVDYQEILESQIIKVNQKSFNQVVILGSATFQPFMQLPTGQRREIIEDILDLQIFTTMNSLLKDRVLSNNEEINKIVSEQKLIQSKIEMTKEHLKELESNNEQLIEEKKKKIASINKEIDKVNKKQVAYDDEIRKLADAKQNTDALQTKRDKLRKLKIQIENNLDHLKDEISFFNKHDNCPTCKQVITADFKTQSITERKTKIQEIDNGMEQLNDQYQNISDLINSCLEIEAKISSINLDRTLTQVHMKTLTKQKAELETEIENISNRHKNNNDEKIQILEQELKNTEQNYNTFIERKDILSLAGNLLKDGGIKAKIIKQYVPIINKLINKYLSSMDFFVSFELDEQFSETIKSRYRDDFSYSSFSEGEKQKIDLALLFTWRALAKLRNSINTNLLIMDEVFDSSLDQNSTDYLMNIIREISKDSNIIIISHKEHMNEKFNNVIRFNKNKNFSQIQE